ncbi:MAG: hypothetical protein ACXWPG_01235 [Ktedonobacteraceae bacterium]
MSNIFPSGEENGIVGQREELFSLLMLRDRLPNLFRHASLLLLCVPQRDIVVKIAILKES